MTEDEATPRYLRFLRSLLVGSALASVPAATGCTDEDCAEEACDGEDPEPDARADAGAVVDGPLPPPDLPKIA